MTPRQTNSITSVSWRGDGEYFSVVSTDSEDGISRVRMFNRNLELTATGRNVTDGDAMIMKGVGGVTAYATNGSYVAIAQERIKGKHQVALVERNGLRHGDFDIRLPAVPIGFDEWQVTHLEWDLPSTLLAVNIRAVSKSGPSEVTHPHIVQLYYRNNYHWYLKQQWEGESLRFLGFDAEVVNRLYMSQQVTGAEGGDSLPAVRIVDITWDVVNSINTADSSTAVVDGSRLLLTPLGRNTVPPPMSLYVEQNARSARHLSFWTPSSPLSSAHTSGLACLLDDNRSLVLLFNDNKGKVSRRLDVDLNALLPDGVAESHLQSLILRAVVVTELSRESADNDQVLNIVLLGSRIASHSTNVSQNLTKDVVSFSAGDERAFVSQDEQDAADCVDELLVLTVKVSEKVSLLNHAFVHSLVGSVSRLLTVPLDPLSVALGVINHVTAAFEVIRVPLTFSEKEGQGERDSEHSYDISSLEVEELVSLPENCIHLAIIVDGKQRVGEEFQSSEEEQGVEESRSVGDDHHHHGRSSPYTVIALSTRNRLYCNDSLLVAGASSFAFNSSFNLLMYITLGTRPHLHFCSYDQLRALDPELGLSDEQLLIDCAEPRPVERGAKLVCSVAGDSKVVIQLPRGNLELFEPRPLILMRAQNLMDSLQFLDCLVLLRRQRVDLNYLVDFKPSLFLENVTTFVTAAFHTNPDLLSLLVSSLEPSDVTLTKYPRHIGSSAGINAVRVVQDASFLGDNKVNTVCREIREVLLPLLVQGGHNTAINPILCTFARQRPPLLVEALQTIRASASRAANASLSTSAVQASIKYLAFLAEGNLLFEAALGSCDYDMSRAVARQCQMDPKAYLPLLERFELMGRGHNEGSVQHALMHFRVNAHLYRYHQVIDWGVKLLNALLTHAALFSVSTTGSESTDATDTVQLLTEVVRAAEELTKTVDKQDLFAYALPKLYSVEVKHSSGGAHRDTAGPHVILTKTLSDMRVQYAAKCVSKMNYSEAITAYLSATPPHAIEAVQAARQLGSWQHALTIAGRYCHEERYKTRQMEIQPQRIAQEIVSEFRENLEQGETFAGTASGEAEDHSAVQNADDKVVEAARLSIEYCDDAEGAVSILTTAQRWMRAMQVAIKFNRKDLQEEIKTAAVSTARELLKTLPKKSATLAALVTELSVIWKDPADRLQKVSTTDTALLDELNGVGNKDEAQTSDTASEYSAVTQQSMLSYRSDTRSIRSGTSTLSILSEMSQQSAQSAAAQSTTPSTSFSIEGLDHSLLSRGKATKDPYHVNAGKKHARSYKRDQTERGQKRIEKSKTRGAGRDVWGLRREIAICDELLTFAFVGQVANSVRDLCELLLVLGSSEELSLAAELQTAMNLYVKQLSASPPPIGPMYPAEWLEKRLMKSIMRYQDAEAMLLHQQEQRRLNGDVFRPVINTKPAVVSWWKLAADGIKEWQTIRSVVYEIEDV
eukprot:gene24576-30941_t